MSSAAPCVLITGIGLVSPLGITTASTWAALISSKNGVKRTPSPFLPVNISAPVDRTNLPCIPPYITGCPDFATFALIAASEALSDADQLPPTPTSPPPYPPHRAGISLGVGIPDLPAIISAAASLPNNYRQISPFVIPRVLPNTPAGLIARRHSLVGPTLTPSTACAAGAHAIGDAYHAIRRREVDLMLAGGAESAIHPVVLAGFARAKALSTTVCRPFDTRRDGFVIGEGAAVLVLESCERVRARGAHAYAEVAGFAATGDAYHLTAPPPDGRGAARAMRLAANGRHVSYVNAHATGTKRGDSAERIAIENAANEAVVSATKGATGHLLGAAGAVEAAFTALTVAEGVLPPTLGLQQLDEGDGDLHSFVPEVARNMDVDFALSNSFGFGGTNACIAFSRVPDDVPQKRISRRS